MSEQPERRMIGISEGMSGHYAVLYSPTDLIQTGIGRYATPYEAAEEARDWAISEGLPMERHVRELLGIR